MNGKKNTVKVKRTAKKDKRSGKVRASWIKAHLKAFYDAQDSGKDYYVWGKKITRPEDIDGYCDYVKNLNDPKVIARKKYFEEYRAKARQAKEDAIRRALDLQVEEARTRAEEEKRREFQDIVNNYKEILSSGELTPEERMKKEVRIVRENPDIFALIFRSSFVHFISFFHRYIYGNEFTFAPHHLKICDALQRRVLTRERLEKPHLMINMPPRAGKTQIIKHFCAWGYAHNPASCFISTACNDILAEKISVETKQIIESDIYQLLFGVKISTSSKKKEYWETEKRGEFRAVPLRGGIVGFSAGVLPDKWGGAVIIDDMLKPVDAYSESANDEVWEIFTNTVKSRRNNKSGVFQTPIIIIAQRLSVMDLCARIKLSEAESEEFEILEVPALIDGKSYWEAQISTRELLKMREHNPDLFFAQYMQDPIVKGGNVIKKEWFKYFSYKNLPEFKRVFLCADTAYTTGKFSDFSAIGLIGITQDNRLYLLDLLHVKEEQEILKRKINEFWNFHRDHKFWRGCNVYCIVVEKRGTGITLIQDLKRMGAPVRDITSPSNKGERALECSEYFRNGYVFLPENEYNPISKAFLNEAVVFSEDNKKVKTIHDDILDMVMYAVQFGLMGVTE